MCALTALHLQAKKWVLHYLKGIIMTLDFIYVHAFVFKTPSYEIHRNLHSLLWTQAHLVVMQEAFHCG